MFSVCPLNLPGGSTTTTVSSHQNERSLVQKKPERVGEFDKVINTDLGRLDELAILEKGLRLIYVQYPDDFNEFIMSIEKKYEIA